MPRRPMLALVAIAFGAVAIVAIRGARQTPVRVAAAAPAAETPRLAAPDPDGPVVRGIFVDDPHGQIETFAAGDHLVAWTVRTPADRLRESNADIDAESPLDFPARSKVVIVDERGGKSLTLDLGRRYVSMIDFLHGARGEPQLVVFGCKVREAKSCSPELLTFDAAAPARLVRRSSGRAASLAMTGRVDAGRRLTIGQRARGACLPRLAISATDGTSRRALPPVPTDGATSFYEKCTGLVSARLYGRYALATVSGKNTKLGLDGHVVYALDVAGGPRERWHHVATPYRYSDGSTGIALGPAVAGDALFYEEIDTEDGDGTPYSLGRAALPSGEPYTEGDPITLSGATDNVCGVAATLSAVYELDNPRCNAVSSLTSGASAIRRLSGKGLGLTTPSRDG